MLQVQVLSGFVVDLSHASNDPLENVLLLIESSNRHAPNADARKTLAAVVAH